MPNLPAHMALAHQALETLGHPSLGGYRGYFLLGSTAPDMRSMTKKRRADYHFAELSFQSVGDGVRGLFQAHPHLAAMSNGDGATRAFVAGYITHLVLDESWIVEMYRPYFGNPEVFGDCVYADVMDRALQLDLDRLLQGTVATGFPQFGDVNEEIDVGFIPAETIADWHRWVLEFMGREFTWERLRFMARRVSSGDDEHPAHGVADAFLRDLPESLDRLYSYVPRAELSSFRRRAVSTMTNAIEEYLS